MYRHAGIDIYLGGRFQGRGAGREAVALLARYLFEQRGHHRITIDPAAANSQAIRCYTSVETLWALGLPTPDSSWERVDLAMPARLASSVSDSPARSRSRRIDAAISEISAGPPASSACEPLPTCSLQTSNCSA